MKLAPGRYHWRKWSPFPRDAAPGQPLPSILGRLQPTKEAEEAAKKVWAEMGYKNVDKML